MKIYDLSDKEVVNPFDLSIIQGVREGVLCFKASRHAYYVARLGLLSDFEETVSVRTHPVEGDGEWKGAVCCFNTMGEDVNGNAVKRTVTLKEGELTPIFVGFDFVGAETGRYTTILEIGNRKVPVVIYLTDDLVFDGGLDDGRTLARLKWLNSGLMRNDEIASPYDPVKVEEKTIAFTGKKATIGENGWIENVVSYIDLSGELTDTPQNLLFRKPMEFSVDGQKFEYTKCTVMGEDSYAKITTEGGNGAMRIETQANVFYEGYFSYKTVLTSEQDVIIPNIVLSLHFADAKYTLGLGRKGGLVKDFDFRWDPNKNLDSVYIGNVNLGARLRLYERGSRRAPHSALYGQIPLQIPRDSWENHGKGGILIRKDGEGALLQAYTGMTVLPAGTSITFRYDLHLTPFHPVDRKKQYGVRILQNAKMSDGKIDLDSAELDGLNYISVHRANSFNPLLNYPFETEKDLRKLVSDAHNRKVGVLICYTFKELSTFVPEYKALRTMEEELLQNEFNGTQAIVGVQKITRGKHRGAWDRSVTLRRGSRMENFYVEGVKYLMEHVGIDGVFMEETFATRNTMERVKKLLSQKRGLPGHIDLGVQFFKDERGGYTSGLNVHTDALPFVDKIWVGTGNDDPDCLLTETTGLLFGLTGEIPYAKKSVLPLLFGMNARYGWYGNAADRTIADVHKFYQRIGAEKGKFYGYWDPRCPVTAADGVKVSAYVNGDRIAAVFYNDNEESVRFDMALRTEVGDIGAYDVRCPRLRGIQPWKRFGEKKRLTLAAGKGCVAEFYPLSKMHRNNKK